MPNASPVLASHKRRVHDSTFTASDVLPTNPFRRYAASIMNVLQLHTLAKRRYSDGWSHLESFEHIGTVKVLPLRVLSTGNGYDDAGTTIQTMVAPRAIRNKADRRLFAKAIQDTTGGSSCRHEYDCCGCVTRHVRVLAKNSREFSVLTRKTRNY